MKLARAARDRSYLVSPPCRSGGWRYGIVPSYEDDHSTRQVRTRTGGRRARDRSSSATVDAYQALAARGRNVPRLLSLTSGTASSSGSCRRSRYLSGDALARTASRGSGSGKKDWLFFVHRPRFLRRSPVVVPVLIVPPFRPGTRTWVSSAYTSQPLLAVWLMKGFMDEIPRAFEEAALVDGYSRLAAFVRVIVPQAATGMAVTAVFCLISSWNEFGFAMTLNNYEAKTVPVYFAGLQGNIDGVPWPQIAAGMMIFVAPIVVFTVLARNHLLRGVTFGTIKQ
jgi:hypothetical protein